MRLPPRWPGVSARIHPRIPSWNFSMRFIGAHRTARRAEGSHMRFRFGSFNLPRRRPALWETGRASPVRIQSRSQSGLQRNISTTIAKPSLRPLPWAATWTRIAQSWVVLSRCLRAGRTFRAIGCDTWRCCLMRNRARKLIEESHFFDSSLRPSPRSRRRGRRCVRRFTRAAKCLPTAAIRLPWTMNFRSDGSSE